MKTPSADDLVRRIAGEVVARLRAGQDATTAAMAGRQGAPGTLPVAVSARHVHVSPEDLQILFGPGYELKVRKWLSQPGQFAAEETVAVVGPKGRFPTVRILGPSRGASQVEVSATDGRFLGSDVPVRLSGDHRDTPGCTLIGPKGEVALPRGLIVAARHIHMHTDDAVRFGMQDGREVRVRCGADRALVFEKVLIRVRHDFALDMHIDVDEGNAAGVRDGDLVEIVG